MKSHVIVGNNGKAAKCVIKLIKECGICQKIKLRTDPMWRDKIEHHVYHLDPLVSLLVDTLSTRSEDENGFSFIVDIVGIFGVSKEIRSDGG